MKRLFSFILSLVLCTVALASATNRKVVKATSTTVEQVAHYYPYGGVIGDISTQEGRQKYKFEGKELDRSFGLDNYDIHARNYFAMLPMWDRVDPLAEKYYGISPYVYCGGDPVNSVDYDGRQVRPNGDKAMSIILNTLPKDSRQYIVLNKSGYIDLESMKKYQGESGNFRSLRELVESNIDIQITTLEKTEWKDSEGSIHSEEFNKILIESDFIDDNFQSLVGNITGEVGNLGVTYMPNPEKEPFAKSSVINPSGIHININPHLSLVGAAETYSHEANGHASIYVQSDGNRTKAEHSRTIPEGNQDLIEKSINSRKETIKNIFGN